MGVEGVGDVVSGAGDDAAGCAGELSGDGVEQGYPCGGEEGEGGGPDGVPAETFADHRHGEEWGAESDGVVEDAEGGAVVDAGGPLVEGVEGRRAADDSVGPDPAGEVVLARWVDDPPVRVSGRADGDGPPGVAENVIGLVGSAELRVLR